MVNSAVKHGVSLICAYNKYALFTATQYTIIEKNSAICIGITLFRKKRFMLDDKLQLNASKFAMFYIYKNPELPFPFHAILFFP